MTPPIFSWRIILLFATALVCAAEANRAFAGGVDFGPDEGANAGPSYFGVVTDQSGSPVPDAKITISVSKLNSTVVERADSQGHFFVQGFDKSVNPKDVNIVCSKTGYQDVTANKTIASDPTTPVQVLCSLQKKA